MHEHLIEEPEERPDSPFVSFLKRTYLIIIALFLVMLLLANTSAGYHIISVVSGRIVSSTVQDNTFMLKDGKRVVFENSTFEQLQLIWQGNQKAEFKVCLLGYKSENYHVTGLYMPRVIAADVYSVTSAGCNENTIISLHSHPPLRCIFSEQDIRSYEQFVRTSPGGLIALMCGEDRMSFYGY